jgi:nucleoid-associated protein YgaU
MLKPPSSVPGPFRPPAQPPGIAAQRKPMVRMWQVGEGETLHGLAQRFYGNSREAIRIFNANRDVLRNTESPLLVGSQLRIP